MSAARLALIAGASVLAVAGKRCPHCDEFKPREAFNKNRCRPDGLQDRCRNCRKSAYWSDPESAREATTRWRNANPDRAQDTHSRWVERNRERVKVFAREKARGYRKNPAFRLKQAVYTSMSRVVTGRAGSTKLEALGYTAGDLRAHLERQFTKGMTWDNYGEWHVDHIVPLSSFTINSLDDPDFKRAWALTNLRPLWGAENVSKGAKRDFLL